MEKAIKKAIKGGWKHDFNWGELLQKSTPEMQMKAMLVDQEIILLDPLFWQALGKIDGVMGTKCYKCAECKQDTENTLEWLKSLDGEPCWLHAWHAFIDHLAQDKNINSFFEELLK